MLQMFSKAAHLVREHLDFCTSWVKRGDLCCFRGVNYAALTLCFKLGSFFMDFLLTVIIIIIIVIAVTARTTRMIVCVSQISDGTRAEVTRASSSCD